MTVDALNVRPEEPNPTYCGLALGERRTATTVVTKELLDAFIAVSKDDAPVHRDDDCAQAMGYRGRVAHGLLVAAPYSRLLGTLLPDGNTVIQSLDLKMPAPVYIGDTLTYTVAVAKFSPSVQSIRLSLQAVNQSGATVSSGAAVCVVRPMAEPAEPPAGGRL